MFTEVLRPNTTTEPAAQQAKKTEDSQKSLSSSAATQASESKQEFPREFILAALEQSSDDAGWANLGNFGNYLNKLQPDFDSRLYGYKKLSDLVKDKTDLFVIEERPIQGTTQKTLYLRAK